LIGAFPSRRPAPTIFGMSANTPHASHLPPRDFRSVADDDVGKPDASGVPRYLDAPAAAKYMCVSLSWLRKTTAKREVPHAKVGVRVIYDRLDLDAYLRARKIVPPWRPTSAA
jgi:hypothetical protein